MAQTHPSAHRGRRSPAFVESFCRPRYPYQIILPSVFPAYFSPDYMDKKSEYLLKLIIIGDCGVGKTNILMRYCEDSFKLNYVSTIGVDFKVKSMQVGDKRLKFQIWDTAGQERYRNITQTYYKGAAGIILVYSLTEEKSFQNLEKWMLQINQQVPKEVVKILVANKTDMPEAEWEMSIMEGKTLADKHGLSFVEASAKTGHNINEIFKKMGEEIVQNYLPYRINEDPGMEISRRLNEKSKKKDCQC